VEYSELEKEKYELIRQRNLYEYGIDIVNNTERMSLNKNILSKHYYVIIPYYPEEASNSNFGKDEIANIAFSELYTKAQSIISSLAVCGINSKILNSTELAELLYVAYIFVGAVLIFFVCAVLVPCISLYMGGWLFDAYL